MVIVDLFHFFIFIGFQPNCRNKEFIYRNSSHLHISEFHANIKEGLKVMMEMNEEVDTLFVEFP